jgi:6-phosphogluconolactonase (cycloisomerase 2 family)
MARRIVVRVGGLLGIAAVLALTGCHNFFLCEKASCPTSGSGGTASTTTDFAYVSNAPAGPTYILGYDLSSGALTALPNAPYNLNFIPVAMAVTPNDGYLYIASSAGATNPGIYLYSIATTGQPTIQNSGTVLIGGDFSSIAISPDGNYLFALNTAGDILTEYQANTSTGALQLAATLNLPGTTCTPTGIPISQTCSVAVSPAGAFVGVSLNTAGTAFFPYTSASGITSSSYTVVSSGSSVVGDFSVAFDGSSNAYIGRSSSLAVYSITASTITLLSNNAYSSTATTPRSVVLSSNYNDVYTANEGTGNISGYFVGTNGALTALSGSPYTGPANVSALGVNKTGAYLLTGGYSSTTGVQLFSMSSTGALTLVTSAGTGTNNGYPVILAMSH